MAELPPELAPQQPVGTQPQSQDNLRQQLGPLVQDPTEDFLAELMSIADEVGILDDAFGPESIEDQADLQDVNSDPLEFLSEQQLQILVSKFLAIPEPQRSQIADELRSQLPPQVASRLEAIVRFVQGRDAQQEITR
jgi:hypothetical protein